MRTLFILLLLDLYCHKGGFGQPSQPALWVIGSYSYKHADILSSMNNPAALAEVGLAGVVAGGQRPYGLPELDIY